MGKENNFKSIVFRYRSRELGPQEIQELQSLVSQFYARGRTYISQAICQAWQWVQPNGKLKEYAARDLLLRLEEKGLLKLPPRLRPDNNRRRKAFSQIPLFGQSPLEGPLHAYGEPLLQLVGPADRSLWDYLVHHHHYLGRPRIVGEHLRYLGFLQGQVVACLGWASAAFKVSDRDRFIGWGPETRRKNLSGVANNVRFLILPWIRIPHLASKILALNLRRLSDDWQKAYGHPLYLAETFVDRSRFPGTCYQASNWIDVGLTQGSAKKGNDYHYHGQPKAIYLYAAHWESYKKLKLSMERLSDKKYQTEVNQYRSKYHHRYPSHIEFGLSETVKRIVNMNGKVSYGFGYSKPLQIKDIISVLKVQHAAAAKCFKCYQYLINEQMEKILSVTKASSAN